MITKEIADFLEKEVHERNCVHELSLDRPDPLMVASCYKDELIALICALFAYGNARAIVRFLQSLDFSLLNTDEETISHSLNKHYYRFQVAQDVQALFISLHRIKKEAISLETIFVDGYSQQCNVMDGIRKVLELLYDINDYRSQGYQFLLGTLPSSKPKSPYKRWHMYLRWMVRHDALDLGLWQNRVNPKDLLIPLDTHTFTLGKKLGLIQRKSYDFQAVLELTQALRTLDPLDPIKYDFALYRLGQEKLLP